VDKAIGIEPKEALFHGLRGEILSQKGNNQLAKQNFDKAVALNPDYFKHYLTRGFVRRELGDNQGAKQDFLRSNQLLPTTEGEYGLGRLAMSEGRHNEAISYFQKASASDSTVGNAAGIYLARLDLPKNPGKYLKTGLTLDRKGYLAVIVQNNAKVKVSGIRVVLGREVNYGIREDAAFRLRQTLNPGQRINIKTSIGPLDAKQAGLFAATVTDARVDN
jgi:tetratricopeptide (TPR) repeat protein